MNFCQYEKEDEYTDFGGVLGINFNFRASWGFEFNFDAGKSKDEGIEYNSYGVNFSSWTHSSPKWSGNLNGGYSRTYNFSREFLAYYSWFGFRFNWKAVNILEVGTSFNMWIEGNPDNEIEEITYNARPYFSLTPINDLNLRVYVDNVFLQSTGNLDQIIFGFLFAYNFSPKSWIYFALNEIHDRSDQFDSSGRLQPSRLHVQNRAAVLKIKYLYYF